MDIGKLKLLGGRLALDFANTIEFDSSGRKTDFLTDYPTVLAWATHAGAMSSVETAPLQQLAAERPEETDAAMIGIARVRDALQGVFSAVASRAEPSAPAMGVVNSVLAKSLGSISLRPCDGRFAVSWGSQRPELISVLWPVLYDAFEILTHADLSRVRQCSGGCGWLFLDVTRNRSRRWCDMAVCGNREKVRRHYHRTKSQR